jgi:hypothetical protein
MTLETIVWILVVLAVLQLAFSFHIFGIAQQALRAARGEVGAVPAKASKPEREAGRRLADAARALHAKVESLPPTILGPGGDGRIRGATLWTAADVTALKPTVPSLVAVSEAPYAKVAAALAWLLTQAEAIRATPRGSAQYLIDFPHDKWGRSYKEAIDGLQQLVTQGEMVGGEGKGA